MAPARFCRASRLCCSTPWSAQGGSESPCTQAGQGHPEGVIDEAGLDQKRFLGEVGR